MNFRQYQFHFLGLIISIRNLTLAQYRTLKPNVEHCVRLLLGNGKLDFCLIGYYQMVSVFNAAAQMKDWEEYTIFDYRPDCDKEVVLLVGDDAVMGLQYLERCAANLGLSTRRNKYWFPEPISFVGSHHFNKKPHGTITAP